MRTLGPPERNRFGTAYPLAHVFARLRIDHPIAGNALSHSGRKAGYRLAGLRLRRTGFAPAGRQIAFQKGLTSLRSREPALTGRTASQFDYAAFSQSLSQSSLFRQVSSSAKRCFSPERLQNCPVRFNRPCICEQADSIEPEPKGVPRRLALG